MRTVVGLYDRFEEAQRVAQALVDAGFNSESISVISRDSQGEYARYIPGGDIGEESKADQVAGGAAAGAGIGAAMGGLAGLLVGLGALTIPGIGPVIAAGPLAAALAGAGIGAAAGGLLGALTGLGIPEEHAQLYAEGVRRGGTLVLASVEDHQAENAVDIMNRFHPIDIEQRRSSWTDLDDGQTTEPMVSEEAGMEGQGIDRQNIPVTGSGMTGRGYDRTDRIEDEFEHEETELDREDQLTHRHNIPVTGGGSDEVHDDESFWSSRDEENMSSSLTGRQRDRENRFDQRQDDIHDENVPVTGRNATYPDINEDISTHATNPLTGQMDEDWSNYESLYRQDFQSRYAASGQNFGYYLPAYRFGYDLRRNSRYRDYDWFRLEPEARREWERRGAQGVWEDVKDAVRHAWDSIRY